MKKTSNLEFLGIPTEKWVIILKELKKVIQHGTSVRFVTWFNTKRIDVEIGVNK